MRQHELDALLDAPPVFVDPLAVRILGPKAEAALPAVIAAMKDPNAPRYSNPSDREELKRRFYEQYTEMLERLRQQDRIKWDFKKGKK